MTLPLHLFNERLGLYAGTHLLGVHFELHARFFCIRCHKKTERVQPIPNGNVVADLKLPEGWSLGPNAEILCDAHESTIVDRGKKG